MYDENGMMCVLSVLSTSRCLLICMCLLSLSRSSSFSTVSGGQTKLRFSPKGMMLDSTVEAYLHLNTHMMESMSLQIATAGVDVTEILKTAVDRGKSGASAASVQVLTLMWLRTTLNYQYRFGTDTKTALRTLWDEGGIPRLYQGLPFAILQGPLSRFGDTAANALILAYLDAVDPTGSVPLFVRTAAGSVSAGAWRLVILPIDTMKTMLQVNGKEGIKLLQDKISSEGPSALYNGAIASVLATIIGHYPWFYTYNTLSELLPTAQDVQQHLASVTSTDLVESTDSIYAFLGLLDPKLFSLLRGGLIGVAASSTSDICSNSLRVLKTVRQTSLDSGDEDSSKFSYIEAAKDIIDSEGWAGLLGRGLETRLLANAVQGALFSVLFKFFQGSSR